MRIGLVLFGAVTVGLGVASPAGPASALSLELAKKCLQLTMDKYPRPRGYAAYKPGHAGTARAREEFYRNCIAKEGNI